MQQRQHYRKCGEPNVPLVVPGDPFTLFYDYDQLEDHKLDTLSPIQRSVWLKHRIDMVFIEPIRRIIKEEDLFDRLLRTLPDRPIYSCFSIALMSMMLSGVEALGSFLRPDLAERSNPPNKEIFNCFMRQYMPEWNKRSSILGSTVLEILWNHFRVGITHGFQIKPPGSLEFLPSDRFRVEKELFQVCPEHFFDDLAIGVDQYFKHLRTDEDALAKFHKRFLKVYPCQRET